MFRAARRSLVWLLGLALGCEAVPGDDGDGSADDGGDDASPDDDVPPVAFCEEVADWDPQWRALEARVLEIVNQHRAQGASCGSAGQFGPTDPLQMDPALRCAARKHSMDMAERGYFEHVSPDGQEPWDRIEAAGYAFEAAGENIAGGSPDAEGTMAQWMGSDGHCSNIMNPGFTDIGVGYFPGGEFGTLWTQNFAAPL